MQLLDTTTWITLDSATLFDHLIHINFLDNLDCGIVDVGSTHHSVIFLNFSFSCEKYDDTEIAKIFFSSIYYETSRQV